MQILFWLAALTLGAATDAIEHPDAARYPAHIRQELLNAQENFAAADASNGSAYGELGQVYQAHALRDAAQAAYEQAQKLAPADARWPFYLGLLSETGGDFEAAQGHFLASLELNPDYAPAMVRLARARVQLGQFDQALATLLGAVSAHPDLAAAQAELGLLLQRQGKPKQAIEHLQAALASQPSATSLHAALGLAYRSNRQPDLARQQLALRGDREVILIDPLEQQMRRRLRSVTDFLTLGVRAADNGDLAGGLAYLDQALAIAPDNVHVLVTKARVLEVQGDIAAAAQYADRALAVDPEFALALEQRGVLHEIAGQTDPAMVFFKRALARDDGLFDARLLLGNELMRSRRYAEAIPHLERLIRDRPSSTLALRLAASQFEMGDCATAAVTLDERVRQQADEGLLLALARVAATCEAVAKPIASRIRKTLQQWYNARSNVEVTTTLAMLEMRHGDQNVALDLQALAIAASLSEGRDDAAVTALRETLAQYQKGLAPTRPWSVTHPIASPPVLRAGER